MGFQFRCGPSATLVTVHCIIHLAAAVALYTSAVPVPGVLLMTLFLGANTLFQVRRANLRAGRAPVAIDFDDTEPLIELNNGRRIPVAITDIYCLSWLQVVRFRRLSLNAGRAFWLVVLPDSADADHRRQLRACLLAQPLRRSDGRA